MAGCLSIALWRFGKSDEIIHNILDIDYTMYNIL
jgi:hypothetical protein